MNKASSFWTRPVPNPKYSKNLLVDQGFGKKFLNSQPWQVPSGGLALCWSKVRVLAGEGWCSVRGMRRNESKL